MTSRWTPAALLIAALAALLAGCGSGVPLVGNEDASVVISFDKPFNDIAEPGDISDGHNDFEPIEQPDIPPDSVPGCEDQDLDGFGIGLTCRGPDCNDRDRSITTQCYECIGPDVHEGCSCAPGAAPLPCDLVTGTTSAGPDGVCHLGQRTCAPNRNTGGWSWGACERWRQDFRFVGPISACPGSCLPTCRHQVICPTSGEILPAGSMNLRSASSVPAVFCPSATPAGGLTPTCAAVAGGSSGYTRGTTPPSVPWVEACATPGHLTYLTSTDDGYVNDTIPFAFPFYGVPQTMTGISSNGIISFPSASSLFEYNNQSLPYSSIPNAIFPFWDDLYQRSTGGVCIATTGSAPSREYVVEWNDGHFCCTDVPTTHLSFEVILSETTNNIDVRYQRMEDTDGRALGNSATIGIQDDTTTRYDLVSFDRAGVVASGSSIRWSPTVSSTRCDRGVYTRTFEGDCAPTVAASTDPFFMTVPFWGQFNYTSNVPVGTSIIFELRAANSVAELSTARVVRLPDAPLGAPSTPTSLDLRAILRAASTPTEPLFARHFVQITAYLNPSADGSVAPTLISTETQYTCYPPEVTTPCREGASCNFSGALCHAGVIRCRSSAPGALSVEVCEDGGLVPPGSTCGTGMVCDPGGACVPCNEGASCSTGSVCSTGRISCRTGAPVCEATPLATGTPCGGTGSDYLRSTSATSWRDICAIPGHDTYLPTTDDDSVNLTLPFTFNFYGSPFSSIGVSSNGMIGFPWDTNLREYSNQPLPYATIPNTLYAFWDDIQTRSGICTAMLGAAPTRQFVVHWSDAHFCCTDDPAIHLDFEAVLSEGTDTIDVLYNRMDDPSGRADGSQATIGLQQGTGAIFEQVGYNMSVVGTGRSIRWTPTSDMVCNSSGMCVSCRDRSPCSPTSNPCDTGITVCTSGVPVCTPTGTLAPGSTCGTDMVCSPAASCIPCREGAACDTGNPCTVGALACSTGVPICNVVGNVPRNTVCTVLGGPGRCDGFGTCTPCGRSETCNGVDDNCDGVVDNGNPGGGGGCTTGMAGRCSAGTLACSGGTIVCNRNSAPIAETCNGIDDDCNGVVDNGNPGGGVGCATGMAGRCSAGTTACTSGAIVCNRNSAPIAETCNGIDDDCNGVVDNGNPGGGVGCTTGMAGRCSAGTTACTAGAVVCNRNSAPIAELCNSVDDDCNGTVDNGNPGGGGGCTTGMAGRCSAGTLACSGGTIVCNRNSAPITEVCNGIDDDCNGVVDNGNPGGGVGCTTGMAGRCSAGTTACTAGAVVCNRNSAPIAELCNSVDDDCNGTVDNGNPGGGGGCTTGMAGRCSAGTLACSGGTIVCNRNSAPIAETCNGIDDDCNGVVDNGNPGGGVGCTTGMAGRCSAGTTACTAGAVVCNRNSAPIAELCNSVDDDCNGTVDNGNPGGGGGCTTGMAGRCSAGTLACSGGTIVCNRNSAPITEVCNGIDDDCNGVVDNGNPGGGGGCTTGMAGRCSAGTLACSGGTIVCNRNSAPIAETCNGIDDDCNGVVDNGNPGGGVGCATGMAGRCSAGTTACTSGAIVCNRNSAPIAETCNGIDDDCNGVVDNGNPGGGVGCTTGMAGRCSAGTTACTAGAVVCNRNSAPIAELCNSVDDDCNGTVDNGNPGGGGGCTTGMAGRCSAGTLACSGGTIVCNRNSAPIAETCNGIDDDCNGVVDNGNPGGGVGCTTGMAGRCSAGTTACTAGAVVCNRNSAPIAELCNSVDDDCNGTVDNGNPGGGGGCTTGMAGRCSAGTLACSGGTIVCNRNSAPITEVCNGIDDDCNGVVDNGNPGGGVGCTTGMAGRCSAGTTACTAGAVVCNRNSAPIAELCNSVDDDCNGTVDNGNPGGGGGCTTGMAGRCSAGTLACSGGTIVCNRNSAPITEVCNGIDDDCNGVVDNGNPGGGVGCATGMAGRCSAGTTACTAGAVVCNRNSAPIAELCNSVDDDCNGTVDNGNPGGGGGCTTGMAGRCSAGTLACSGGTIVCNRNSAPITEVCNGIDDDCDGVVDDGNPGGGASCSTGNVCTNGALACVGGSLSCQVGSYNNGVACSTSGSVAPSNYTLTGTSPLGWINACAYNPGNSLGDDGAQNLALPFPFRFYGTSYTGVGVNSNGWIGFPTASAGLWSHMPLPYSGLSNVVVPFWDDLYQRNPICWATLGAAPNRQFVIEWNDAMILGDSTAHLTFEVILSESTNTIDVLYQTMSGSSRVNGTNATTGIQQGTGGPATQRSYNTSSVYSGTKYRWTPTGGLDGVCSSGSCVGTGVLRFTLGWSATADLDLHVVTPCGTQVYFGNPAPGGSCAGVLDRDDTYGIGPENVFWTSAATVGSYTVCAVPWSIYSAPTSFSLGAYVNNTLAGGGFATGAYYSSGPTTVCARYSTYYVGTFYYAGPSGSYWYW